MCPPIICSKTTTTIAKLTSIISLNLLSNLHYQTIVAIIITLTTFLISSISPQTAEI